MVAEDRQIPHTDPNYSGRTCFMTVDVYWEPECIASYFIVDLEETSPMVTTIDISLHHNEVQPGNYRYPSIRDEHKHQTVEDVADNLLQIQEDVINYIDGNLAFVLDYTGPGRYNKEDIIYVLS